MDAMPCHTVECSMFGDDSLGRAAYVCYQHRSADDSSEDKRMQWDAPWQACQKVWREWLKTAAARQQPAPETEEGRDISFVNSVASTLR